MPPIPTLERVKDLLADGQTEAATDLLLELAKTTHRAYYHSALLLKNRLETLQHNVIEGILSPSEERIEWARISKGVVGLVEQIDRGEAPRSDEEVLPPKPDISRRRGFPVKAWWVLPLLILAGIAVPKVFLKKESTSVKKEQKISMVEYQGQVERADGRPAANVKLVFSKGEFKREVMADGQGRFSIGLPEKLSHVTVEFYLNEKLLFTQAVPVVKERFSRLKIPN